MIKNIKQPVDLDSEGEVEELAKKCYLIIANQSGMTLKWEEQNKTMKDLYRFGAEQIIKDGWTKASPNREKVPLDRETIELWKDNYFQAKEHINYLNACIKDRDEKIVKFSMPDVEVPNQVDILDTMLKGLGIKHNELSVDKKYDFWKTSEAILDLLRKGK